MSDWVTVNGARIERSYLEQNVAEARAYAWTPDRRTRPSDHGHCLICSITISGGDTCHRSEVGLLCAYCFGAFVS